MFFISILVTVITKIIQTIIVDRMGWWWKGGAAET